jgi:hypothetical protein
LSLQEHVDTHARPAPTDAEAEARNAILKQIAAAADAAPKLNASTATEALRNLAEAYALVTRGKND